MTTTPDGALTNATRQGIIPANVKHLGNQVLTVDATAGGVALTVPAGCLYAVLRNRGVQVYYTLDASAPTSSNGSYLSDGDSVPVSRDMLAGVRLIRAAAVSSVAHVDYFG